MGGNKSLPHGISTKKEPTNKRVIHATKVTGCCLTSSVKAEMRGLPSDGICSQNTDTLVLHDPITH